jgi:hypothetical protein
MNNSVDIRFRIKNLKGNFELDNDKGLEEYKKFKNRGEKSLLPLLNFISMHNVRKFLK